MTNSCLAKQFLRYAELDSSEIELLETLETNTKPVTKGQVIRHSGETADSLYTLSKGWAMSYKVLANGNRQVLDFFLPGQIAGLDSLTCQHATSVLIMLTPGNISSFSKQTLTDIFAQSARLTDLFYMSMSQEHALRSERIVNLGAKDSLSKVAHFIIEIAYRVQSQKTQPADLQNAEIKLPFTQEIMGQALGITSIHVNRCLAILREGGYIEQQRNHIRILRYQDLATVAEFDERSLAEDLRWIRKSPANY